MRLNKTWMIAVALIFTLLTITVVYTIDNINLSQDSVANEDIDKNIYPYIEFTETAGMYNHSIILSINSNGDVGTIYYTIDCSKPTQNDMIYTGEGISLELLPGKEKVYTIRAVGIKEDGSYLTQEIVSTYILNQNADTRYTTAVLSLVTEKSNLNDRKTGIFSNQNIQRNGIEFERDIHVEYFEINGQLVLSQHGGVRLFGGYSRAHPQKSLRLYARESYDETGLFYFNPLNNQRGRYTGKLIFEYQKILIRNSGNDWCVTQFRDAAMQKIAARTVVDYQDYRPMTVYLNGEYYGILNFREDTGPKYFENHYGVPEEGVTVISSHLQNAGIPKDKTEYVLDSGGISELNKWKKDLAFAISADMSNPDNYEEVCRNIDVENFAQYMLLQIYYANTDWPQNNLRLWRFDPLYDNRIYTDELSCGYDGRWRFVLKDTDFGMHLYDGNHAKHNTLAHAMNSGDTFGLGKVLSNLLKNKEFKDLFIINMCDILNYAADPEYLIQMVSEMQIGISGEIPYHLKKWKGSSNSGVLQSWDAQVEKMRKFIYDRPKNLLGFAKKTFKLNDEVTLTITGSEHGIVFINSIPIKENETKTFKYFTDMMIKVRYEAKPGYVLDQYNLSDTIEYRESNIVLHGDAYLQPVFIKDEKYKKTLVINEYMESSTNDSSYDWVEIYNNSDSNINLKDYFLTDDINNIDKWQFPGYTIKSGGYIVLKLTGKNGFTNYNDIHTNFKISDGETLVLAYRDASIIDSVKIEKCESNSNANKLTMGIYPNGTGVFCQLDKNSPGESNSYTDYSLSISPSLHNRVLVKGELKDTSYYAHLINGEPYVSINGEAKSALDYAESNRLKFIYVYNLDCIIFSKK